MMTTLSWIQYQSSVVNVVGVASLFSPSYIEEIQAYVQKQCDKDDVARHKAISGIITLFEQEILAKEDLRKQYAECKDISPQRRDQYLEVAIEIDNSHSFSCESCDFEMHIECALLLPKTVRHRYDKKHAFNLSYFPVENHAPECFCDICESSLIPTNRFFYHCNDCDQSMRLACAPMMFHWETPFRGDLTKGDVNNGDIWKYIMSFVNGDWWQDLDKALLMSLKSLGLNRLNGANALNQLNETETDAYVNSSPFNLVSFWVTNVDRAHRDKNSVNVNGIITVGITIGGSFGSRPYENNPTFSIYPGHSELSISFQGIVSDTDDSNGEIVMCLLGNTMLPYRYPDKSNPWDWVNEPGYINQPPLIQDDQILLVIRYPKTADKLVSKACTPYPYKDEFMDTGIEMYKGADFCLILERFTGQDFPLTVLPNRKCNGTEEYCSRLGLFDTDASIKATNGSCYD
nr:hypothetical protein CTI12_AA411730 [Tanacetum cinerariifolium]